MNSWEELVTTALLGTDRRPLPLELSPGWASYDPEQAARDPAGVILDLAASHRALRQAGVYLSTAPVPEHGPTETLPSAPNRAQDVMAGLLAKPEPGLVNLWLGICAARGLGLATELWPRLAQLASRNTSYDRALLLSAFGLRGAWFLRQNPAWARLAEANVAPATTTPATTTPATTTPATTTPATTTPADPDRVLEGARTGVSPAETMGQILSCADPLPLPLVAAALRIIAGGMLGPATRDAARSLSHRIPLDVWAGLPDEMTTEGMSDSSPALVTSPIAQLSLAVIRRTVQARIDIEEAFQTPTEETT